MAYTLGQAAKATGKERSTIQRAIKNGKVSAAKNEQGQWEIDPAELHRVYPPSVESNSAQHMRDTGSATIRNTEMLIEIAELRVKLEAATERERLKDQMLDEARSERDRWQAVAEKQTEAVKLLSDQRQQETQKGAKFFGWRIFKA